MSSVSLLFFSIEGDSSKLNASLREAVRTAEDAGVKITRTRQSFISKFNQALHPTRKLAEQIQLLEKANKLQADVMKVMGVSIANPCRKDRGMDLPVCARLAEAQSLFL